LANTQSKRPLFKTKTPQPLGHGDTVVGFPEADAVFVAACAIVAGRAF